MYLHTLYTILSQRITAIVSSAVRPVSLIVVVLLVQTRLSTYYLACGVRYQTSRENESTRSLRCSWSVASWLVGDDSQGGFGMLNASVRDART